MSKRRDPYKLCRYDEDEVTPAQIDVAKRRVMPHLMNFHIVDWNLQTLLVACYLQGCRDLAETMVTRRMLVQQPEPINEDLPERFSD